MRAVGFLAGVGTLLREAKDAGMEVVGNFDDRSYFRTGTWIWNSNFDAPFFGSEKDLRIRMETEEVADWYGADLAIGHPPCGSYSALGRGHANLENFKTEKDKDAWESARNSKKGKVPLFLDAVMHFMPKTFIFDNLPKLLKVFSIEDMERMAPGYKIQIIEILNWDYGSPQKRKRIWVFGTRGDIPFRFRRPKRRIPGPKTGWEAIKDLPWEPWIDLFDIGHVHHDLGIKPIASFWAEEGEDRYQVETHIETCVGFLRLPIGHLWPYENTHGRFTKKFAHTRISTDNPARTPSGSDTLRHPFTGWTLTARERARLMGWPDDFKLWDGKVKYNRTNLLKMVRMTGRAVPSEFPRFIIPQIMDYARKIT